MDYRDRTTVSVTLRPGAGVPAYLKVRAIFSATILTADVDRPAFDRLHGDEAVVDVQVPSIVRDRWAFPTKPVATVVTPPAVSEMKGILSTLDEPVEAPSPRVRDVEYVLGVPVERLRTVDVPQVAAVKERRKPRKEQAPRKVGPQRQRPTLHADEPRPL